MTDKIYAPWAPEQVDALNRFQQYGGMHPFTCGRDHHGTNVVLMAHRDGWHCSDPACDYRQEWAHAFMANPEAWPKPLPLGSFTNPHTGLGMATGGNTPLICSDERHQEKVADLERQLDALRSVARGYCPACGRGDASPTAQQWEDQRQRAEQLAAALREVLAQTPSLSVAKADKARWHAVLDENAPATATAATGFVPFTPPHIPRTGDPENALVVEPYRNDRGEDVWVFRCWGTDSCDGWLSLDHYSRQSAERARDGHVAEEHQ